ncbi:hypothetical protein DEU56DRAFT_980042 [Suillus clintonianus]|uniref:uncharacterized protein n=1 Tax=Suillus clintonianus TaxID=1904413 RepID=UPI001B872CCA|nr:uncharacterized protein DEU56DRAFT_980042 [Suillus clintonianus]KAG2140663.1 hypothetical protein DEU56DRAFT_980042 [Suillus clintonianus]
MSHAPHPLLLSLKKREGMQAKVVYHEDLTAFARANSRFVWFVENIFADFVISDKRTQDLPHTLSSQRRYKFVRDRATSWTYRCGDQGPHWCVQFIRHFDTLIPTSFVSGSFTSPSPAILGKLADLFALKRY